MDLAALPVGFRKHFHNRPFEPRMVVAAHENYALQTTFLEAEQKVLPARGTFPVGHFHSEHLAPTLPINANGDKNRPGTDHSVLTHFLIARIQNQIGILAIQFSTGKAPELLVELLVEGAYRAGAKTVPAELLADRFDFPSRYPLDVHLSKRGDQRLLAALIALENLGGKKPLTILGNSQLELAHPGDQATRIVTA